MDRMCVPTCETHTHTRSWIVFPRLRYAGSHACLHAWNTRQCSASSAPSTSATVKRTVCGINGVFPVISTQLIIQLVLGGAPRNTDLVNVTRLSHRHHRRRIEKCVCCALRSVRVCVWVCRSYYLVNPTIRSTHTRSCILLSALNVVGWRAVARCSPGGRTVGMRINRPALAVRAWKRASEEKLTPPNMPQRIIIYHFRLLHAYGMLAERARVTGKGECDIEREGIQSASRRRPPAV